MQVTTIQTLESLIGAVIALAVVLKGIEILV